MTGIVHIIGAGLAGLSAAVRLSAGGAKVRVYEANAQAGGRCRSYHDRGLDLVIDNGNHLLLSGNRDARAFLRAIGADHEMVGPAQAEFPFIDLQSGERWTLRPNAGPLPWWIFSRARRVPGTTSSEYLSLARFLLPVSDDDEIEEVLDCDGVLYDRMLRPVLLAALNVEPPEGSAALAAAVIRETLARGGRFCRPLIARNGLSAAFIDPAIAFIRTNGGDVQLESEVRQLVFEGDRLTALAFGSRRVDLAPGDKAVLAVPPWIAGALVPGLKTPTEYRAILNAHFKIAPPASVPSLTGVVNGLVEWLFAFPDRLSVTVSNADRLINLPREDVAAQIWQEVAKIAGIAAPLPPWQIVRERRATFVATVAQNAMRPQPRTGWSNLVLAGDWTATGLPATIEGAIRSGHRAAAIVAGS
ncbi:MAG: hydroxysqualene dehydroxylase HpnE [Pseudorhodoplanes sp.]